MQAVMQGYDLGLHLVSHRQKVARGQFTLSEPTTFSETKVGLLLVKKILKVKFDFSGIWDLATRDPATRHQNELFP